MSAQQQKTGYSWLFASFEKHERGMFWYAIAGAVVGLLLVWSYLSANILFGLLLLIFLLVLFLRHVSEPASVECEVSDEGIRVGTKEYPFSAVRYFWILEHQDGRIVLYIEEKGGLRIILPIPIHDHDPAELRSFLKKYVEEERERTHEPLLEWLSRSLKI